MYKVFIKDYNQTHIRIDIQDDYIKNSFHKYFVHKLEDYLLRYDHKYQIGLWDGKINFYEAETGLIYKGFLKRIIKYLNKHKIKYFLDETLRFGKHHKIYDLSKYQSVYKFYDYQEKLIQESLNSGRLLLQSPTSSGKTFMIYTLSEFFKDRDMDVLIVVPNVDLVYQMGGYNKSYNKKILRKNIKKILENLKEEIDDSDIDNFLEEFLNKKGDFEEYGGSVSDYHLVTAGVSKNTDKKITISTWQSLNPILKKDKKYFHKFKAVIIDEAHLATGKTIVDVVENCINAVYKFGLSGTYDKPEMDLMTLEGLFGPLYKAISTHELIDRGFAPRLNIIMMILEYISKDRYDIINTDYKDQVKFIRDHLGRAKVISKIISKCEGNTICIFRHHEHINKLLKLVKNRNPDKRVYVLTGRDDNVLRIVIKILLNKYRNCILMTTEGVMSTGVSIKTLKNLIMSYPNKGYNRVLQILGRLLRNCEGIDEVYAYDIVDDLRILDIYEHDKLDKPQINYSFKHANGRLELYEREKFSISKKRIKLKKCKEGK